MWTRDDKNATREFVSTKFDEEPLRRSEEYQEAVRHYESIIENFESNVTQNEVDLIDKKDKESRKGRF